MPRLGSIKIKQEFPLVLNQNGCFYWTRRIDLRTNSVRPPLIVKIAINVMNVYHIAFIMSSNSSQLLSVMSRLR